MTNYYLVARLPLLEAEDGGKYFWAPSDHHYVAGMVIADVATGLTYLVVENEPGEDAIDAHRIWVRDYE